MFEERLKPSRLLSIGVGLFALALTLSLVYLETRPQNTTSIYTGGDGQPRDFNLILSAHENKNSIPEGQDVLITMILKNPLATNSDLPTVRRWALSNLSTGACGLLYPLGIGVYDARGMPVDVLGGFAVVSFCPAMLSPENWEKPSFHFGPHENITQMVYLHGFYTPGQTIARGYYDSVFHPFVPGDYTVVVGDIWGHLAVTHFTVVPHSR